MSRGSSLLGSMFFLGLGNIIPKIASFIVLPVLTGCMTIEEYGAYDLLITAVSLMLPFSTLQIQNAVFRYLIECRGNKEETSRIISSALALEMPLSAIVMVVYMCVTASLDPEIRVLIFIYYMLDVAVVTLRQFVRGLGNNKVYSASALFHALFQILLSYLLVSGFGLGLYGTAVTLAGSTCAAFLYLSAKSKIWKYLSVSSIDAACIKKMVSYSWPLVPNQLSVWVLRMSNRWIITALCGITANALFAAAFKVPQIISFAQGTFQMAWQENASLYSDDSDIGDYYKRMFGMLFGCVAGFASITISATPVLYRILIQGDYSRAYPEIPILVLAMLFSCLVSFYDGICVARRNTKAIAVSATVAAVINVVLCFILVPMLGITGASIAMLTSYAMVYFARVVHTGGFISISYDWGTIVVALVVLSAQVLLCIQQSVLLDLINVPIGLLMLIVLNRDAFLSIWKKAAKRFA